MNDKNIRISKAEKIANDFLLQFAYAIAASIVLLFIYNGSLFKYGGGIGSAMPKILWTFFGLFSVAGVTFIWLWKRKKRNGFKITAIYFFVTAGGFFWCVGLQQIAYFLSQYISFFSYFANTKRLMEMLFGLIGISVVAEIFIYFYRLKNLKSRSLNK